jgi:adenylate cyclase
VPDHFADFDRARLYDGVSFSLRYHCYGGTADEQPVSGLHGVPLLAFHFGDMVLDTERRELRMGSRLLALEPLVFDLLEFLIRNRDHVVSRDELLARVWGGRIVSDSAIGARINAARRAICDDGQEQRWIRTIARKGFRFVGPVREEQVAARTSIELARPALALPDKPSIAVLPFTNVSGDPEQEYFADGIVEDIITELARFSELFVIARNSAFQYKGKATDVRQVGRELGVRYVLEGSVRKSGNRLRISTQLIDTSTGAHCWAERYDREPEDVFAVQDEVVRTIAAILAAHVRKAETERTRAKAPNSWQAYDYYLQAADVLISFDASFSVQALYEARRLLKLSLAVDPNYARAYALLASAYEPAWVNPLDRDYLNSAVLDQAHQFANRAVELDKNLPLAHAVLGHVLMWKREHDASIAQFERAIALNPNYVDWRFGLALVLAGNSERAIEVLNAYMRLDPFHPPLASGLMGWAHFMLKQYSQALPVLRNFVAQTPNLRFGHFWLAATYAQLGDLKKARTEAAEVLRLQPNYTIDGMTRRIVTFKDPNDDKHFFHALRKAGLPNSPRRRGTRSA